ncbi:MAG: hypothetical protein K8T20_09240 [Planctomycetes bacterium]|nr:hypothetical protein [Planctomycetota bacterium]
MPTLAPSFTRDWLATRREELNGRFRIAKRRSPSLDPQAVLDLCAQLLPALGGTGEEGAADLLSAAYDLILLHAGRGTLTRNGGSNPAVPVLFRETFPSLRPLLLSRPRFLPGALSNAAENLGARGEEFARRIVAVGGRLERGNDLPDAVALVAWRLGEARLRVEALKGAGRLPAAAVLEALQLGDWPPEAASLAVAGLEADGWRRPDDAISESTVESLSKASPRKLEDLRKALSTPPRAGLGEWEPAGRVGDFSGFGGGFDEPPLLLAAPETTRHRFWALAANGAFRIEADIWGWSCRPDPAAAGLGVSEAKPRGIVSSILFGGDDGAPRLDADGTLSFGGESRKVAGAKSATSSIAAADAVAWTIADSHRIRILVPRTPAL